MYRYLEQQYLYEVQQLQLHASRASMVLVYRAPLRFEKKTIYHIKGIILLLVLLLSSSLFCFLCHRPLTTAAAAAAAALPPPHCYLPALPNERYSIMHLEDVRSSSYLSLHTAVVAFLNAVCLPTRYLTYKTQQYSIKLSPEKINDTAVALPAVLLCCCCCCPVLLYLHVHGRRRAERGNTGGFTCNTGFLLYCWCD